MAAEAPPPAAVQPPVAIAAVGSVARALVGAGSLSELAEHALAAMCEALGLRVAALYLPDADDVPILRRFAASGADVDTVALLDELRFEQEAWRLASAGGRALVFHEPATWLVANPFDPPASAWLVLPLDAGGEVVGVVAAAAQRHPFALEETSATVLAILGDLLGAGIAAARLRQRIARTEVERERLRLAAEIHDGLAQDLALAKREIALLDSEPTPAQAGESRARLREAVGAAHRIVRARLEDLSTRVPIGGLHDAVAAACDRARERGLPVELRAAAAVEPAEPETTAVVLRVLGEALANVERHAGAGSVVVVLDGEGGALVLTVDDDGRGLGAPRRRRARAKDTSASRSCASARRRSAGGLTRRPRRCRRDARPARGPAPVSFAEAVEPRVDGGSCPHMAVVLRSGRELPAVLVSFYALGARRGGWVVHHALPGAVRPRPRAPDRPAAWTSATSRRAGSLVLFEFDPAEAPDAAAERFEPLLADALARGHSALWYSRFPIGPGAVDFANATAYDRAWDARFRGRPVVTLCPYVLAGDEAGERIAHLDGWHDAVLDADGRVIARADPASAGGPGH